MSTIVDNLLKRFEKSNIVKFDDIRMFDKDRKWVTTGSPQLDWNLRTLGLPVGISTASGKSKSGKTTLAMESFRAFLDSDENAIGIILSSEERDNRAYGKKLGLDVKRVLVVKAEYVEDLLMQFKELIEAANIEWKNKGLKGKAKVIGMWDSVGATNSREELETFEENTRILRKHREKGTSAKLKSAKMASFAGAATRCVKAILPFLHRNEVTLIVLNHLKDSLGYGGGKYSPGGAWLDYIPAVKIITTRIGWEKIDDVQVAQYTKIDIDKNDFGTRKSTIVEILLGYGFVLSEDDIAFAVKKGILQQEGKKKYVFLGKMSWKSKREFYDLYRNNNKLIKLLHKKITNKRHELVLKEKEKLERD